MNRSRILSKIFWRHRPFSQIDYARPCSVTLGTNPLIIREQCTVILKDSYIKKFMKAVGWMDQERTRLKLTGYFLYECVPDKVAYAEWFEDLELPDTFASWFMITELHVWLLLVRYMAEDAMATGTDKKKYVKGDGHFVRNCIIEALWADVGNRIKLLEGANPAIARNQVTELSEQFQASLVAYDEGLSDDKVLAGAAWRRFYSLSEDVKAEHVARIVHFIRHQLSILDKIPSEDLRWKPQIDWLSIRNH
ncbi:ubiquinol-cytochrome-c reductase complex assembly factor 1-like [Bicyclus anynana]|uniref:Ubiquinol-cytochrome-c reductase complex assembly factor 1 n=1 Tax=Bicyclus anynana TaxID=110368 RepID=A0A6J1NBR3_BICAN|nr:ubiquinol-cytochrome-c reductase complex assembly factor 1 [Bicyclus anynana]XP_052740567.1 ubiquinol-cytochrome-c reductase complex assembly factor 1-like [Bicyclus anynana]